MSTFQGFKITGIDPDKLPFSKNDQGILYDQFHLLLKPIGAYANTEERKLWGYLFSVAAETWNEEKSYLRLEYIPAHPDLIPSGDCGEIRVSNTDPSRIGQRASDIKDLVDGVNSTTLYFIKERERTITEIGIINSESFRD